MRKVVKQAADKVVADKAIADRIATDKIASDKIITDERDALKGEVERLEKLTGKAAKPPAGGGAGDKKLIDDEWLAEELKKGK